MRHVGEPNPQCKNFLFSIRRCLSTSLERVLVSEKLFPSLGEVRTGMPEEKCVENFFRKIPREGSVWDISRVSESNGNKVCRYGVNLIDSVYGRVASFCEQQEVSVLKKSSSYSVY